jgi:hypothetical protein
VRRSGSAHLRVVVQGDAAAGRQHEHSHGEITLAPFHVLVPPWRTVSCRGFVQST